MLDVSKMDPVAMGQEVIRLEAETLTVMADTLDDTFAKCAELLLNTEGRVAVTGMGKSGHIARKIAATLASTGTPAFFIHPAEASHGDLGMMTQKDTLIAISNSGNTAELSDILYYATRYTIPLIAITKKRDSKLGHLADYCLVLPATREACPLDCAPTSSTTAALALGDALAMVTLQLRGFTATEFNIYHPGGALGRVLMPLADVMCKGDRLPLVTFNSSMDEVLCVMTGKGYGCAGVMGENGQLIGIITDGDLRRHMGIDLLQKKALDVMTQNPITVTPDYLVTQATRLMEQNKITSLFVVKDKKNPVPVGIVNIHILLQL